MKLPTLRQLCVAAGAIHDIPAHYERTYEAKPFFLSESCADLPYSWDSDICYWSQRICRVWEILVYKSKPFYSKKEAKACYWA